MMKLESSLNHISDAGFNSPGSFGSALPLINFHQGQLEI